MTLNEKEVQTSSEGSSRPKSDNSNATNYIFGLLALFQRICIGILFK